MTQPDRPVSHGQRVAPSPVKRRAQSSGVPVLQPPSLRDPGWPERLAEYRANVAVVVAFGQIMPRSVLNVPARGSINVHASLLPRYRGAARGLGDSPRGDQTGITTFQMDQGMDTGDILLQERTIVGPEETAGELAERLARLGADALDRTLDHSRASCLSPRITPRPPWRPGSAKRTAASASTREPASWSVAFARATHGLARH